MPFVFLHGYDKAHGLADAADKFTKSFLTARGVSGAEYRTQQATQIGNERNRLSQQAIDLRRRQGDASLALDMQEFAQEQILEQQTLEARFKLKGEYDRFIGQYKGYLDDDDSKKAMENIEGLLGDPDTGMTGTMELDSAFRALRTEVGQKENQELTFQRNHQLVVQGLDTLTPELDGDGNPTGNYARVLEIRRDLSMGMGNPAELLMEAQGLTHGWAVAQEKRVERERLQGEREARALTDQTLKVLEAVEALGIPGISQGFGVVRGQPGTPTPFMEHPKKDEFIARATEAYSTHGSGDAFDKAMDALAEEYRFSMDDPDLARAMRVGIENAPEKPKAEKAEKPATGRPTSGWEQKWLGRPTKVKPFREEAKEIVDDLRNWLQEKGLGIPRSMGKKKKKLEDEIMDSVMELLEMPVKKKETKEEKERREMLERVQARAAGGGD